MRIDKICKTCGFDSNGVCGMYTTCKEGEECDDWEASLEYYTEITKKAPWYIKKPYDQCKISYEKFLALLQQDEQGVGVEINIYDAIEKGYYAEEGIKVNVQFPSNTNDAMSLTAAGKAEVGIYYLPESFFDEFLSTQLDALKKCREEFRDCYGDELIEKFKQNGYAAMEAKIEKQNAVDKIKNEKYREENQNRYQYKEKTKMYHDLSDDYKSRDYVIAITLK